ncbi:MAG: LysM peptidoglycan-binding domain-containing protein [bacterium]|jgi:LysM repeat protein|nr:LysM peptidoglycan-binding domain-containing protein [bacterium]
MIKFIVKTVIVLLALQSAMNYLRKEEIIEGSIEINYPVVQQKLVGTIPAKKIAAGILHFTAQTIQGAITTELRAEERSSVNPVYHEEVPAYKIVYHVVNEGESLNILSQKYNIHWRVIQKVNRMDDAQPLYIGQVLKIPTRNKNLDHYSI